MATRPINNGLRGLPTQPSVEELRDRFMTLEQLRERGKDLRMTQPQGVGGGTIDSTQTTTGERGASGKGPKFESTMWVEVKYGISTTGKIIQHPPIKDGSSLKELTDKLNEGRGPGGGVYGQTMPVVKIGERNPYGSSDFNGPIAGGFTVIQMGIITKAKVDNMLLCKCVADCVAEQSIGPNGGTFEDALDRKLATPNFSAEIDDDGGFYLDMRVTLVAHKRACGGDCEMGGDAYIDELKDTNVDFREYLFVIAGRFPKGETVFTGENSGSFMQAIFKNQLNEPTPDGAGGPVYNRPGSSGGAGVGSRPDGYKGTPSYGDVLKQGMEWADNHENICAVQSYTL